MKIVINKCFGGFGLSQEAILRYTELKGIKYDDFSRYDVDRSDPILVQIVEEMGSRSWSPFAELKVVEIPDDVEWVIEDYDGIESIHEVHRVWK